MRSDKFYPLHQSILMVDHDIDNNMFYDECGQRIDNILDLITPNDLFLFRIDPVKYYVFTHRDFRNLLIQINEGAF